VTSGTLTNLRLSGVVERSNPPVDDADLRRRAVMSDEEACARLSSLSEDLRQFAAIDIASARALLAGFSMRASFEFGCAHGVVWLFVNDEESQCDREYHRLAGHCSALTARAKLPGNRTIVFMDDSRQMIGERMAGDSRFVLDIYPPRKDLALGDPDAILSMTMELRHFATSNVVLGILEILDDLFHAAGLSSGRVVENAPRARYPGRMTVRYDDLMRPMRYEMYLPYPSRGDVLATVANFRYPTDKPTTWVLEAVVTHLQPPDFSEEGKVAETRYWLTAFESGDVWPPDEDSLDLRIGDSVKDSRTTPPIVFSLESPRLPTEEEIKAIGETQRRMREERERLEAAGVQAPRRGLAPRPAPWYLRPGVRYALVGSACGALLVLALIRWRRSG
jgi:hypothetical protein